MYATDAARQSYGSPISRVWDREIMTVKSTQERATWRSRSQCPTVLGGRPQGPEGRPAPTSHQASTRKHQGLGGLNRRSS